MTETNLFEHPVKTPVEERASRVLLVYIGTRPFKIDAADDAVLPGEAIGDDHPYANHTAQLALRTDFRSE